MKTKIKKIEIWFDIFCIKKKYIDIYFYRKYRNVSISEQALKSN